MNDGRVHDGARADPDAVVLQVVVKRVQHRLAQIVPLQETSVIRLNPAIRDRVKSGHREVLRHI